MKKNNISNLILIILVIIIFSGALYYDQNFVLTHFDNIVSTIIGRQEGASPEVVIRNLYVFVPLLILTTITVVFFFSNLPGLEKFIDRFFSKDSKLYFLRDQAQVRPNFYLTVCLIISVLYLGYTMGIGSFTKANIEESNIYANEYIDPKKVDIKFPDKKKNLIHIYLESMETSVFSKTNGGDFDKAISPELEKLAQGGVNFSFGSGLGGFKPLPGTTWTQAALIAQESAVNYKPLYDIMEGFEASLPGLTTLGDILKDNGYDLTMFMGSDAGFANRKEFFIEHGYNVQDYKWAKSEGLIPEDYHEWWGYEDKKLFDFAKDVIAGKASQDQPFAFSMLTADTHFSDGYVDESCPILYDVQFYNSYACSSSMVYDFIKWIQAQDFYEDTVVVITGDHFTMQADIFDEEDRYLYNAFLNTSIDSSHSKNRQLTSVDIFPTILGSLGVEIKGNRLGLGVNLFSGEKSLAEKYGFERFEDEIYKDSDIYQDITQKN